MAQTSIETIQEQIEHEMSLLEMDFNNGVQWSMQIFYKTLKRIRKKGWESKAMHKADCIRFAEQWEIRCNEKNMDSKEQLYDEIYKK